MPPKPDTANPTIHRVTCSDPQMKQRLVDAGSRELSPIAPGAAVDFILRAIDARHQRDEGPSLEDLFREGLAVVQQERRSA